MHFKRIPNAFQTHYNLLNCWFRRVFSYKSHRVKNTVVITATSRTSPLYINFPSPQEKLNKISEFELKFASISYSVQLLRFKLNSIIHSSMPHPLPSKTLLALSPILILSQFSGLFPFKLETLRPSRFFAVISLALTVIIISALIYNLTGPNVLNFDAVLFVAFKALTVCPSVTGVILLTLSFTVSSDLSIVMEQLSIVENRFPRRKRNFSKLFLIWEVSFR